MATVLADDKTIFLPFNQGNGEQAGNPPCQDGSETSYLWRDVLAPRSLLQILSTYAMWQPADRGGVPGVPPLPPATRSGKRHPRHRG